MYVSMLLRAVAKELKMLFAVRGVKRKVVSHNVKEGVWSQPFPTGAI